MTRRRTFARLLGLVAPYRWWMAVSALLGFATIGSSIGLMSTSAYIIAKAALHPSIGDLQVAIVGVRFFGISRGVFRYAERLVSHNTTFKLLARLRVWFYERLEPLAPARLMEYRSGDLLSRIVADIETLEHFYVSVLAPPVVAVLVALTMVVFMGSYSFWLALVLLLFLILAGVAAPALAGRMSRGMGRRMVETRSELNVLLVDGIQGIADLTVYGREEDRLAMVRSRSEELTSHQLRMAWVTALHNGIGTLLSNLGMVAVVVVAIPMAIGGGMAGVSLAVLALAALSSFEAVLPLPQAFQYLGNSMEAARRLFEIVDAEPAVEDPAGTSPEPRDYGIRVEGLRFAYPSAPDDFALDGVDFHLPEGGRLAIVGPSGAGKSTLVNLLLRFWDYRDGSIRLGGHELREYRQDDLRRMLGVVSQSTYLFNATVRENLMLARPGATEEEMVEAARRAQVHDFIVSLPKGYDTFVGEQGLALSGGERQRIAIARALLKDAPILILDEATANLDALTEREVLKAIHELMEGRTTLMITHRLVGMEWMDEILVLKRGRVVERGTHRELLELGGFYRQMWDLQNQVLAADFEVEPVDS